MGETKQGLWQEAWLEGSIPNEAKKWLETKIDAFLASSPNCMVKSAFSSSNDSTGIKYASKATGSSFLIARYGDYIQHIENDTSNLINLGIVYGAVDKAYMTFLEGENYLLIKTNKGESAKNTLAFIRYDDSVYCHIVNDRPNSYTINLMASSSNILETTPDTKSQLAPDEILLGQYFNNGVLIENVYSCTQTNIPKMVPFEVTGLGACIQTGVGLVKL